MSALEFIFKLITMVITLAITYYVIPWLKNKQIYDETITLVKAAEQIFVGSQRGEEKYDYVCNLLSEKFNLSQDEVKNIIESAVYEIKKGSK